MTEIAGVWIDESRNMPMYMCDPEYSNTLINLCAVTKFFAGDKIQILSATDPALVGDYTINAVIDDTIILYPQNNHDTKLILDTPKRSKIKPTIFDRLNQSKNARMM